MVIYVRVHVHHNRHVMLIGGAEDSSHAGELIRIVNIHIRVAEVQLQSSGSFSRAAERRQVAQPSLSQQVLKLEEDLGAKLFDRLGRRVRLTEVGRAFIPHARPILEQMDVVRAIVSDQNADLRGSVAKVSFQRLRPIGSRVIQRLLQRSTPTRNCASSKKRHRF